MTDTVRYPLVLGIISLCSAAGLAVSYRVTYERIRHNEEVQRARGVSKVLGIQLPEDPKPPYPWAEKSYAGLKGRPPQPFVVYEATDVKTSQRLYAAEGKAQGYSSKVHVIAAVGQSIEGGPGKAVLKAIAVVGHGETPGLGSRCEEPEFQRQFERLPEAMLDLVRGAPYRDPSAAGGEQPVAAITGATITSNAVIDAVLQALKRMRHHLAEPRGRPREGEAPAEPPR